MCCAKGQNVSSFVIKVVEKAAGVGTAREKKAALGRSSPQRVVDMEKMRTELDEVALVAKVAEVGEKTLKALAEDLNVVVQIKIVVFYSATKENKTHWRENYTTVEVTRAVRRLIALAQLKESGLNDAVRQSRATRADNDSAVMQERLKRC